MAISDNPPWNFNLNGMTFPQPVTFTTPVVTSPLVPSGQMVVMPNTNTSMSGTITLSPADFDAMMKAFRLPTDCHVCLSSTGGHPLECKCSCHDSRTPEQRDAEARQQEKKDLRAQRKLKAQLLKLRDRPPA